ncbi:PorP/SprF family type IX secretion system membrane protein [Aquimarina rhabdastrellae]
MIKKLFLLVLCYLSLHVVRAQEEASVYGVLPSDIPTHSLVKYNRFYFNPTFSLVRENKTSINVYNKVQWATFNDNPQTYLINYTSNFDDRMGVSIGLFQQNEGIYRYYGGVGNYAYNVELDRDMNLTFGVNLHFSQSAIKSNIDSEPVTLNNGNVGIDPVIQNYEGNSVFLLHPGVNFNYDAFDVGIAVNNLVAYNISGSELITDYIGFRGHVMYTTSIERRSDKILRAMAYANMIADADLRYGANMILELPKLGWAQAGYNSFYGVSVGIGGNINPNVSVGYTFETGFGDTSSFGTTHEVGFAYNFGDNRTRYRRGRSRSSLQRKYEERDSEIRRLQKEIRDQNKIIKELRGGIVDTLADRRNSRSRIERSLAEENRKKEEAARELEIKRNREVELLNKSPEQIVEDERRALAAAEEEERIRRQRELDAENEIRKKAGLTDEQIAEIAKSEAARIANSERIQVIEDEKARLEIERRLAAQNNTQSEEERIRRERELQAEEQRLAAEKAAEEERIRRQRALEAEEQRIAAEKAAEEERIRRQRALEAEEQRIAAEKAAEEERIRRERELQAEEQRIAAEKAAEEERIRRQRALEAEEQRIAAEKAAEEERIRRERELQAEEQRIAAEKAAEEERVRRERELQAEEQRIAAEKAEEERVRRERELQAEEQRIAAEKAEEERVRRERELQAEEQRIAAEKAAEEERVRRERELQAEEQRIAAEKAAEEERVRRERELQAEEQRIAAEKAAEEERVRRERELQAEEQRIAAEKAAEEERVRRQRELQAEEQRIAAEKAAEEERVRRERELQAEEQRIAAEKAAEEERVRRQRELQAEEQRIAAEKAAEEERVRRQRELQAEEQRIAAEKAAEEERVRRQRELQAEEQRIAAEKAAEEERVRRERELQAEEQRIAAEKAAEEERVRRERELQAEQQRIAAEEAARKAAEEEAARKAEEERIRRQRELEAEQQRIAAEEAARKAAEEEAARKAEEERIRRERELEAEQQRIAAEEEAARQAAASASGNDNEIENIKRELESSSRITNRLVAQQDSLLNSTLEVDKKGFQNVLQSLISMTNDANEIKREPGKRSSKRLIENSKFVKYAIKARPDAKFATKYILDYPEGYYLIGNVFKADNYAKKFTETLNELGFDNAQTVINPENDYRYVAIQSYKDKDVAVEKYLNNIDGQYFGDMWILKIAHNKVESFKRLVEETRTIKDQVQDDSVLSEKLSYIGGHNIQVGYYLITDTYKKENYLERGMARLRSLGLEPQSFRNPKDNYTYVYLKRFDSLDEAKESLFSNVNNTYNGDLFILKIE